MRLSKVNIDKLISNGRSTAHKAARHDLDITDGRLSSIASGQSKSDDAYEEIVWRGCAVRTNIAGCI